MMTLEQLNQIPAHHNEVCLYPLLQHIKHVVAVNEERLPDHHFGTNKQFEDAYVKLEVLAWPFIDGIRNWGLIRVKYDGKLVMYVGEAGRGGKDAKFAKIVDMQAFKRMLMYLAIAYPYDQNSWELEDMLLQGDEDWEELTYMCGMNINQALELTREQDKHRKEGRPLPRG